MCSRHILWEARLSELLDAASSMLRSPAHGCTREQPQLAATWIWFVGVGCSPGCPGARAGHGWLGLLWPRAAGGAAADWAPLALTGLPRRPGRSWSARPTLATRC
jgi:hypothetical protein